MVPHQSSRDFVIALEASCFPPEPANAQRPPGRWLTEGRCRSPEGRCPVLAPALRGRRGRGRAEDPCRDGPVEECRPVRRLPGRHHGRQPDAHFTGVGLELNGEAAGGGAGVRQGSLDRGAEGGIKVITTAVR